MMNSSVKKTSCSQHSTPKTPLPQNEKPTALQEPSRRSLMVTQAGIVLMVAFITFITIKYCTTVYFSREDVLTLALSCSQAVLARHQVESWIQNGTLLGCRRISRFVVWDADLDIGVHSGSSSQLAMALDSLDNECFGYTSSVTEGTFNSDLHTWRKCNSRICAQFHETVKTNGDLIASGSGQALASTLFPLQPCVLAGVPTSCPADTVSFLVDSFGHEWFTVPLRYLFDY